MEEVEGVEGEGTAIGSRVREEVGWVFFPHCLFVCWLSRGDGGTNQISLSDSEKKNG